MSFLGLEGYHVFVTGAAGGIGSEVVKEFLRHGCKVTAHDLRPIAADATVDPNFFAVTGDISSESSIAAGISAAIAHFGPINILICNAGITDQSAAYNIWEIPLETWEESHQTNVRGTFLTIKHFLRSVDEVQKSANGQELENVSIVVMGSGAGDLGAPGHAEYASGKAGLQIGLVRGVKNEIVKLNSKARINAVAPGWVDTVLIKGLFDDPKVMWEEAQATVPLKRIAKPEEVARTMVFLSSHRAAGHITGECLAVDGGMEGRLIWKQEEMGFTATTTTTGTGGNRVSTIPAAISIPKRRIQVLLSVDFDAVSGFLGTGASPTNGLADYSSGYFAGQVGVPRLLRLFQKHGISSSVTWFVPGHSIESFPDEARAIAASGAEIGCHGYAHEGATQMTETQESEVIEKCVKLVTELSGKKPRGWRAPLYQIRDHTIRTLEESGFLYDTSLAHHDSSPYFLLARTTPKPIDFSPSVSASSWMHPIPPPAAKTEKTLVEIPCNWYMEDMTPMQFLPAVPNSHGFVSPETIANNWKARFDYLYQETIDGEKRDFVFPLVLHPDTSGMAHVIGMIDRMIQWLKRWDEVEFVTFGDCAAGWKMKQDAQ